MDVRPGLVVQGIQTELTVELPRLRPGAGPASLRVEGAGIDVLSTTLAGVAGPETLWRVRLRADGPPGPVPVTLRAGYPDGKSVVVRQVLTVVPAMEESLFPWPAVVAGVVLAVALALAALRLARRRTA